MAKLVVTGSASGIGKAITSDLESAGKSVISIDIQQAEIEADLCTVEGRRYAIDSALAVSDHRLDGVVVCAGLGPQHSPTSAIAVLNFFGATELLSGLRPALAKTQHAAAVAICSNSATITPGIDGPLVEAFLEGDEARARQLADELDGASVYGASKLALGRFIRRNAPSKEWAGSGIRLNAVAPGAVQTPLLQGGLDDPTLGDAIRSLPIPLGNFGNPKQIADAVLFLLGPNSSFCCGSILYSDGGSDALIRPDSF